ncbi:MAG: VanW family protein [Chloroherpetonaceae bacterium]|nr:VanW family protein [Chthonomonadaceae bacterium]MDW8207505.1 VanW family protein [Chloroherpetonaceae bacterium]
MREKLAVLVLAAGGAGCLCLILALPVKREVVLAGYATSLRGRTGAQRFNAEKAARTVNGTVIAPGAVFSFNRTVRSWTWDRGYMKAPVSYDGEMIPAYGGGVCQTATTLYNAALLAGMLILERHPHVFATHYAPPGRDAAVAQYHVDLRFQNPYPFPVRIETGLEGDLLLIRLVGERRPEQQVEVISEVVSRTAPKRLTRTHAGGYADSKAFLRQPGAMGCRVITYRVFSRHGREVRRERLSDDLYQPMDRIVSWPEARPAQ